MTAQERAEAQRQIDALLAERTALDKARFAEMRKQDEWRREQTAKANAIIRAISEIRRKSRPKPQSQFLIELVAKRFGESVANELIGESFDLYWQQEWDESEVKP